MTLYNIIECLNDITKTNGKYTLLKESAYNSFSPAYTTYTYTLFYGDTKCFVLSKPYRIITKNDKNGAILDMEKAFVRQLLLYMSDD